MNKIVSSQEMAQQIFSGSTIAINGYIMAACPENLIYALEQRFLKENAPKSLTVISTPSVGDGKDKGLNRLAHKGLLKKIISGHFNWVPKIQNLILNEEIEAYNLPQDCIAQLMRESGANRPGLITKIGLDTFVDPRYSGGRLNNISLEDLCDIIHIDGEEYIHYKPFKKIDFAFIRGTYADAKGNISFDKEAYLGDALVMATVAHNTGGKVFVQVESIVDVIPTHNVVLPSILVDNIIIGKEEFHHQSALSKFNPVYCGHEYANVSPPVFTEEKGIIAKRALKEIDANSIINLGIGIPEGISSEAAKKNIHDFTLTVDAGTIGGIPSSGADFGCASNPDAILYQHQLFDFYNGGGLNQAFLGLAEVDEKGNINVSKFGSRLPGCGGFIGITQSTKKLYFLGTFTTSGLHTIFENNELKIIKEGKIKKFKKSIEQQTFSAKQAIALKQKIMFITERCVFILNQNGLVLTEIAPGIDIKKNIFDHMEFEPEVSPDLKIMDYEYFTAN